MDNPNEAGNVLTAQNKVDILDKLEKGDTCSALAAFYNVNRSAIYEVRNKKDVILGCTSKAADVFKKQKQNTTKQKKLAKDIPVFESVTGLTSSSTSKPASVPKKQVTTKVSKGKEIDKAVADIKNKKDLVSSSGSEPAAKKQKTTKIKKLDKTISKKDSSSSSTSSSASQVSKQDKLEKGLVKWFTQRKTKGELTTERMMREVALEINKKNGGPKSFKASSSWLKSFKYRNDFWQDDEGEEYDRVQEEFRRETYSYYEESDDNFDMDSYANLELDIDHVPSHEQAYNALETVIDWYQEQKECKPKGLAFLKRIQGLADDKEQFGPRGNSILVAY